MKRKMCSGSRKTMWISLSLAAACAILVILALSYCYLELTLRVLLAREQVKIFASMREKAHTADIQQAIECLEYTMRYYPSGTKQVQCSPLDEIVETSRTLAIVDMITLLRQESDKDFGSDPTVWLENRRMVKRKELKGD
jgi:hypothetical protein